MTSRSSEAAAAYRQRARDLLAKASDLPASTPEKIGAFAWFLVTCRDKSFRDPIRALELAQHAVDEASTRGGLWLTLALADYRNGNWQASEDALQKSINLADDGVPHIRHWLLGAMIRFQQGREDEARQWHNRAVDSITRNQTTNEDTLALAAEAAELVQSHEPVSAKE